jgi:chromosome partitioning protein
MSHIIAICNQKGGVGKSTTAEGLAEGLTRSGKKTLLVDLDPQGSISLTAGASLDGPTIYEVMTTQAEAAKAVQQRPGRTDIIPSGKNLSRLDIELITVGKEYRLKERIKPLFPLYDYIVIDTPPSLSILTTNALTAADSVIITAQADVYSLQGIGQLYDTIVAIKEYTNPTLSFAGILLTRHSPRSILSRDMARAANDTAKSIGTFLYTTVIREGIALKEAQANRQSIYDYAPKSNAAADYAAFTDEYLARQTV